MSIPFIDLKAQYKALQPQIQERINRVLEHLCCPDCTPIAHKIVKHVISLPMSPDLSAEDQDKIVSALLA